MVQREDMNDYVCFTCLYFSYNYFCTTRNYENTKVGEKETPKTIPTIY